MAKKRGWEAAAFVHSSLQHITYASSPPLVNLHNNAAFFDFAAQSYVF